MFKIRTMTDEDLSFAVRLTDEMEWNMSPEDFKFNMGLEPRGCFVLLDGSERIGLITSISYGKVSWFGNLIVSEARRKKGAGTLLVKHTVKYLLGKKGEAVGIYANVDKVPFYEKLGFKGDFEFVVLKGRGYSSPTAAKLKQAGKGDIQEIVRFDELCFGASRRKLLEQVLTNPTNSCYICVENGKICGFAVAKSYGDMAELGPLVCARGRSDVAVDLVKACLNRLRGLEVHLYIPEKERPILSLLMSSGFREDFRVTRMFFKAFVPEDCIYLAESLERG